MLALTQQPPLRHWPLKAPEDLGGCGGAPSGALCSACCLCLAPLPAAGAAGAGDPPSLLPAPPTFPLQPRDSPHSPLSFLSVFPCSRSPGPPGLQGDGAGLPAHLGLLSSIHLPPLLCNLGGERQWPPWATRLTQCLGIEGGRGASKSARRAKEGGAAQFVYIYMKLAEREIIKAV